MAVNKNALIRYKTIDACLQNRYRKWTLEDLVEACSAALDDCEGIKKGISVRTVQMDIQMMRSSKLGYNAPIIVRDKKYYAYEDPKYTITNIPLTQQDLATLGEVADILRQFKGFTHFQEVDGMIGRLEQKIFTNQHRQSALVHLEQNEDLKGLQWLAPLYNAIQQKQALWFTYQSFKARQEQQFVFHPQLLKEYRNRWFVLGYRDGRTQVQVFALDRIIGFEASDMAYEAGHLDASYFDDIIGVTRNEGLRESTIVFWVNSDNAPYVRTKPLHRTQEVVEERTDGVVFSIRVRWNFELERELLGFGEFLEVLQPAFLRKAMQRRLTEALARYTQGEKEVI